MFTKISNRSAAHSSGFKVYAIDLTTLAYEDDSVRATVETDFLDGIPPLYCGSLEVHQLQSPATATLTASEIINRMSQALDFLEITHEVVNECG